MAPPIAEVEARFEKCDDLKRHGWQPSAPAEPTAPRKARTIKTAVRKGRGEAPEAAPQPEAGDGAAPAAKSRRSARSFLAQARERQRQLQDAAGAIAADCDIVVALPSKRQAEDGELAGGDQGTEPLARRVQPKRVSFGGMVVAHGSTLLAPVHGSGEDQLVFNATAASTNVLMTPVRRSARKV